jgi:hypothetical protein
LFHRKTSSFPRCILKYLHRRADGGFGNPDPKLNDIRG